eukprot:403364683
MNSSGGSQKSLQIFKNRNPQKSSQELLSQKSKDSQINLSIKPSSKQKKTPGRNANSKLHLHEKQISSISSLKSGMKLPDIMQTHKRLSSIEKLQSLAIVDARFKINKETFVSDKDYVKKKPTIIQHVENMKQMKRKISQLKKEMPEVQISNDIEDEEFNCQNGTSSSIKLSHFEKYKFQKPGDGIFSYKNPKRLASFLETQMTLTSQLSQYQQYSQSQASLLPNLPWNFEKKDLAQQYRFSVIGEHDIKKELADNKRLIEEQKIARQRLKMRMIIDNNTQNVNFQFPNSKFAHTSNTLTNLKPSQSVRNLAPINTNQTEKIEIISDNQVVKYLIEKHPEIYQQRLQKQNKKVLLIKDMPQFQKNSSFQLLNQQLDSLINRSKAKIQNESKVENQNQNVQLLTKNQGASIVEDRSPQQQN